MEHLDTVVRLDTVDCSMAAERLDSRFDQVAAETKEVALDLLGGANLDDPERLPARKCTVRLEVSYLPY